MFWGLVLEPGKRYAQTVRNSFHVSMATLDMSGAGGKDKTPPSSPISVLLEYEGRIYTLCTLSPSYQQPLDLNFETKEQVLFYTSGGSKIPVHLSGYIIPEEMMMGSDDEEDDEDVSDEEEEDLASPSPQKRKGPGNDIQPSKKQKINDLLAKLNANRGGASDSDDDDSADDTMGDSFLDDEADESDEEDDSDEPTPKKPVKKPQTPAKQQVNKSPQKTPQVKTPSQQGPKTPQQGNKTPNKVGVNNGSPAGGSESAKKKKKKNKKNKNKGENNVIKA